jgi:hypothetical protein
MIYLKHLERISFEMNEKADSQQYSAALHVMVQNKNQKE